MTHPNRPPTVEEIKHNASIEVDGKRFYAAWYPQMGGYVGRAWLELHTCGDGQDPTQDGFNALVYHDGEFPNDGPPLCFHHCDAEQFIRLGQLVLSLNKGH